MNSLTKEYFDKALKGELESFGHDLKAFIIEQNQELLRIIKDGDVRKSDKVSVGKHKDIDRVKMLTDRIPLLERENHEMEMQIEKLDIFIKDSKNEISQWQKAKSQSTRDLLAEQLRVGKEALEIIKKRIADLNG